jgi:hypothetical protein
MYLIHVPECAPHHAHRISLKRATMCQKYIKDMSQVGTITLSTYNQYVPQTMCQHP